MQSGNLKPYLTVLIPAYNEAENISESIRTITRKLQDISCSFEIVVVDDGSTDDTAKIVKDIAYSKPFVRLCSHQSNTGPGSGIQTGIKEARGGFIIFIPADIAMDINQVSDFIDASKDADIVVGLRSDRRDYSLFRKFVSCVNIIAIKILFGMKQQQFNYISMYRSKIFERINVESRNVFVTAEIMIKARDLGFKLREIEVGYLARKYGKASGASLKSIFTTAISMFNFWLKWITRRALSSRKIYLFL